MSNSQIISEKFLNDWVKSLTTHEKEAIFKYTLDGKNNYYQKINNHLRGIEINKEIEIFIKHIDSALKKFNLNVDINVYRVQGELNYNNLVYNGEQITLDDILTTYKYVKKYITFKNYISTSISEQCAINHLENYLYITQPDNFFILMRGILKAGSSCGYIQPLSKYKNEQEVLIMRNKQFDISRVDILNHKTIILEGEFKDLEETI
ncbi:MAG: ADP-ribosyltransferase [Cetobacterium sp.]